MVLLDLDLRPGSGLGKFELGTSLWNILDLLREEKTRYPHVDVKFDTQFPATSPVILHIRPHFDLLFSGHGQRLHTISIRRLRTPNSSLTLKYKEVLVSSPTITLNRGSVNKVFGPTYAGDTLRYPGMWFGFEEDGAPDGNRPPKAGEDHNRDRNAEVKRVVICQRSPQGKEVDSLTEIGELPSMKGELESAIVKIRDGVLLQFYSGSVPSTPVHIRIGSTSSQDLICDLGSPLRVFYKEDDRMNIHSGTAQPPQIDNDYFYNYLQYGMDVLLSGRTHIVRKIILHTNIPGSLLFQRYKRCPWEIHGSDSSENSRAVSFDSRIETVASILTTSSQSPSMELDRSADMPDAPILPNPTTKLLGFDGVVLEVTKMGDILTVMLF